MSPLSGVKRKSDFGAVSRKDKDLAGINTIWISDLVPVRFVDDCVSHARAVGDTADAPEAVTTVVAILGATAADGEPPSDGGSRVFNFAFSSLPAEKTHSNVLPVK